LYWCDRNLSHIFLPEVLIGRPADFLNLFPQLNLEAPPADGCAEEKMNDMAPLDVLIVDDSAAIRKILHRIVRQSGLNLGEIKEAGDGDEAVSLLKDRAFGLILSDINMPHMDGLQMLARIKEMDHMKNVPIIMVTTEGGQGRVMEAVQLGATDYVRKPFTCGQIKEKISAVFV
jgi:two-component system chemotaxis response regulator CheY